MDAHEQSQRLLDETQGHDRSVDDEYRPTTQSTLARLWQSSRPVLAGLSVVLFAAAAVAALYHVVDPSAQATTSTTTTATTTTSDRPDLAIHLHPEDHAHRAPTTLHFVLHVARGTARPDGVLRDVLQVNGQFPGPTLEARTGDVLEVTVVNGLDDDLAMHWHGLHMRGAADSDGPIGVAQCAIPPGGRFQYTVPTANQSGTFWYHAHADVQRADGLWGGLVVHAPAESESDADSQYDADVLLLAGDWYHEPATRVFGVFQDPVTSDAEPVPESLLVNGLGAYDCAQAAPAAPVDCRAVAAPVLALDPARRYRVRVVNTGSLTGFSLAVDGANMHPLTVDGGRPLAVEHTSTAYGALGIVYPAQRVDFVLSWPAGAVPPDAALVVDVDDEYYQGTGQDPPSRAFRIAVSGHVTPPRAARLDLQAPRLDLQAARGARLASPLPDPDADRVFMVYAVVETKAHNGFVPKGYLNHTTWAPQRAPLLAVGRARWDARQLAPWTGPAPAWVELTVNNLDAQGHPFHLHGHDVFVVGTHAASGGWDYYQPWRDPWEPPRGGAFDVATPLQRDTVYVPPMGYAVLRFRADNPGVWLVHCHILWHQAAGMAMAFHVQGGADGLADTPAARRAADHCRAVGVDL